MFCEAILTDAYELLRCEAAAAILQTSSYAQSQKKGVPVMKEKLKAFAFAAWSPQEKILLAVDLVLAGVLIGWLTSPLKGGIRWFCDNSFGGKFYEAAEAEEEEEV